MDTETTGWRATPAPLLVAFATWLTYVLFRLVWAIAVPPEKMYNARVMLTGEGVSLAGQILVLVGVLELVRRAAGARATSLKLASAGMAFVIVTDIVLGFVQFTKDPWEHRWVYTANEYTSIVGWNLFAFGLVRALPAQRRVAGWIALGIALVCWLPPIVREPLWSALGLEKSPAVFKVDSVLRLVRFASLLWLSIAASAGLTPPAPTRAAEGFRSASKALWIRVVAALVVVMFTLMAMAGSRGAGAGVLGMFKLVMMGQAIFGVIALAMFGFGVLRVASAGIPELMPFATTVGGGASLWAAGVSLAQLPYLYGMLYRDRYDSSMATEWAQALSIAVPVVVIVGVGVVSTALSGYAARRGNDDLRSEAQGKGLGFVGLMLVSIAIQNWMIPKAGSLSAYAMLALLAAAAGLWATVLMARLLTRASDELEREPGLPAASIVSDGAISS